MRLFKRHYKFTAEEKDLYDLARSRFNRLHKADALDWCDLAGSGMARALDDYRRLNMPESLIEAKRGVLQVLAAIDVLAVRSSG